MTKKKTASKIIPPPESESRSDDSANRSQPVQSMNRITAIRPGRGKPGPTAPLKNGRYERFAQQIAGGRSASEAYRVCGYRGKGRSQSACRLLRRPEVAARVESLRMDVSREVVSQIAVNTGWVVDTLVQIINRAMQDCNFGAATHALNLLGKNMGMFQLKPGEMAQQMNLADRLVAGRKRLIAFRRVEDEKEKVRKEQQMAQEAIEKEEEIERRVKERLALRR